MTVHPEASEQLREQMSRSAQRQGGGGASVRPVSASVTAAAARAVAQARERLGKLTGTELVRAHKQLRDATRSLQLAEKIREHRARPVAANPFAAAGGPLGTDVTTRAIRDREATDGARPLLHLPGRTWFVGMFCGPTRFLSDPP